MRNKVLFAVALFSSLVAATDGLVAYSMLTKDGRRMVSRQEGTNVVYELVATNALPKDLPPVRPWKLYAVKATHTDIGLHNSQYIQRHGTVKRLEEAMRLVDADPRADDDPAAYRYVCEGVWFWENYPMDRGEAAAWNVVTNYMRRGRIDVGASCAGNHTHVFGPEEIRRAALTRRHMVEKWGVKTRTMLMIDNPGLSWSLVRPFAEVGFENVLFAPNQWNPIPSTIRIRNPHIPYGTWNPDARGGGNYIDVSYDSDRPMVFRWESPDASTNLLVWCSTQYAYGYSRMGITPKKKPSMEEVETQAPAFLAQLENKYPYDVWLAAMYGDDESPTAEFAEFAAAWNAKWAWPQFRTMGRLDEPFDDLRRRFGDRIPVVRGEMTSGWLQHVASAPELLAAKFEAERKLVAAEEAWRNDPHRDPAWANEIDRAWWHLILNDEHSYGTSGYQGRRVFETWMQHRDWIAQADDTATRLLADEKVEAMQPVEEPVAGTSENEFYRVAVNERGEILSIYDKELGRELLAAPANRFLYTRDNHVSWCDESLLGAKISRTVSLPKGIRRIDVEDRFEHARDLFNTNRYYRFGYLAFPFAVPGGRFKAALGGGEVIDPYRDQSGYATDAYVAARDWCAVENGDFGVALFQRDTSLTEFGAIHPDKTCFTGVPPTDGSFIYSYAFTDWLQMHHPDGDSVNFTFRYAITSYVGGWESTGIPAQAEAFVNPWRRPAAKTVTVACPAPPPRIPVPKGEGDEWTGLLRRPQAGHGERDGQLYLLWGAELSPEFDHYELWRNGTFVTNVVNEAPDGIPYRVARYEDVGLGRHTNVFYTLWKVWKGGRRERFGNPFCGLTRYVFGAE